MARKPATRAPLPLVPATCTTGGSRRSGDPKAFNSRSMRSSPRSITRGWRRMTRSSSGSSMVKVWNSAAGDCDASVVGNLRIHQQRNEPDQGLAQLVAMHHGVDHAVLQQVLRTLEAGRQFLADRILDYARAGEADDGVGLGKMDIAQHGE